MMVIITQNEFTLWELGYDLGILLCMAPDTIIFRKYYFKNGFLLTVL